MHSAKKCEIKSHRQYLSRYNFDSTTNLLLLLGLQGESINKQSIHSLYLTLLVTLI